MEDAPIMDTEPGRMRSVLAQRAHFNDAALWQAAGSTMPVAQRESLETLHLVQQRRAFVASNINLHDSL